MTDPESIRAAQVNLPAPCFTLSGYAGPVACVWLTSMESRPSPSRPQKPRQDAVNGREAASTWPLQYSTDMYHLATMIPVSATFTCADPERAKLLEGVLALLSFFADGGEAPSCPGCRGPGWGSYVSSWSWPWTSGRGDGHRFPPRRLPHEGNFRPAWAEQVSGDQALGSGQG
jgi:hypothetical protein